MARKSLCCSLTSTTLRPSTTRLGHTIGDLLLKEVAERLKRWTREQDTVARLGGDEFLVLVTAVNETEDALVVAERIVNSMAAEFVIQGHILNVTCSLGISIFPDNGEQVEALLKNADLAMYRAKENGRNNFQLFTQEMNVQAMERMTLESSLRMAIERKELSLEYQPQKDLATGEITGARPSSAGGIRNWDSYRPTSSSPLRRIAG